MKPRITLILLLLSLTGSAASVWAQAGWRNLPPDDRRQMRQDMRDHWHQERELRRENRDAGRQWGDVPPEDRRRMREEIRDQRDARPPEREDLRQRYGGNGRRD